MQRKSRRRHRICGYVVVGTSMVYSNGVSGVPIDIRITGRNLMMYQKILIATDGSELAGRAVAHGLKLAKELNVPVVVVTVTRMWSALEIAHEARTHQGQSD